MESLAGDVVFRTPRLLVRRWRDGDAETVEPIYADPEVMQYIPGGAWSAERTSQIITRMRELERESGLGFYPVVRAEDNCILGHCGLGRLENGSEIEVAYILGKSSWHHGYASEVASATMAHAFDAGLATRIVAVAFPENLRSIAVMQRIGMQRVGRAQHFGREVEKYEITATLPNPSE